MLQTVKLSSIIYVKLGSEYIRRVGEPSLGFVQRRQQENHDNHKMRFNSDDVEISRFFIFQT